ncbi:Leucine-rich repeat receptor protein kinase EMS1 [Linum perenne]
MSPSIFHHTPLLFCITISTTHSYNSHPSPLYSLFTLDLFGNGLSRKLLTELEKLMSLKFLDLNNNFFSDEIPDYVINKFHELTSLDIPNKSLSGSIPQELGNLDNSIDLYIRTNSFSSRLPPKINSLTRRQNFFSPSCSFSGPLPDSIINLASLTQLDLPNNQLHCKFPK